VVDDVISALGDGIRRVNRAPGILVAVWLMTMAVGVVLTLTVRNAIDDHLGTSLEAEAVAAGASFDWMQEFRSQASGPASTFGPSVIGFASVLDNLSSFIDNTDRPVVLAGAAAVYLLLWVFLAGGVIDRYARDRATRAHGFFAACGVFFFRFLRLGVGAWIVYAWLFGYVHPFLFDEWYPTLTLDVTAERTAFLIRAALYLLFAILLGGCNLVFDYAKVRAVVEDRRSMLGAVVAAIRFIQRNFRSVSSLYLANVALFVAVLLLYAIAAPGAATTWIGFAIGQVYILARLWVKLGFWASETALFQSRLAHAGYVARPVPQWPESPVVEAITRS